MKKLVVLITLFSVILCGCSQRAFGNPSELTKYSWYAQCDGGGELSLKFEGETAALTLKNGDETATITGKVLADDNSFVIFDTELKQNYAFSYTPRGELLDLTFEGNTIEMKAEK